MRTIISKYPGMCTKCQECFEVGDTISYEKSTGVFCPLCTPTDTEEIRSYRQAKASLKADRYEEWARKRTERAETQLNSYPSIRSDYAFNTQPGHIPLRARMIAADHRAFESLKVAERMQGKAESLRNVRVKGDAARKDEEKRNKIRPLLASGTRIFDYGFGNGTVVKVNQKSAKVLWDNSQNTWSRDLIFLYLLEKPTTCGINTLDPDDIIRPCILAKNHEGFCQTGKN